MFNFYLTFKLLHGSLLAYAMHVQQAAWFPLNSEKNVLFFSKCYIGKPQNNSLLHENGYGSLQL